MLSGIVEFSAITLNKNVCGMLFVQVTPWKLQ
jgi:hypothetical protein